MYMSSTTIARLQARLTKLEDQIDLIDTTLDTMVTQDVESFALNTGEGSQTVRRYTAIELDDLRRRLETRAENIRQRLAGYGVVNMNVRRKDGL